MKQNSFSCRGLLLALMCLLAVPALFAANITHDGINYTTKNQDATVAKYTINKNPADTLYYKGDIVIPETFEEGGITYTVVATAANAFLDCRDLTSLVLPNTCVTIGRNSFKGCTSLTVSPIPSTVTSVGNGALSGCSSLEEVTVSSGWGKIISENFSGCPLKKLTFADGATPVVFHLEAFGKSSEARVAVGTLEEIYFGSDVDASAYANNLQPFHNLTALKKVTFSGEATSLSGTMFQGCTALTDVIFAEGNKITSIGTNAFQGCTALQSITIPDAVTEIAASTFINCRNLTTVNMGPAVTSIGQTAFYKTGLTSITLPATVTTIGANAFENSKLAGNMVLPAALTSIGGGAFAGTLLSGIEIPAGVTSIGSAAFAPIAPLAEIKLAEGNTAFKLENGVLTNAAGTRLLVTAHEGNIGTTLNLPDVQTIDNYGLAYAPYTAVELPALTSIGAYGFAYSDIENFSLKSNVTVGSNIFAGSALQTLVIEDGRNEIPQGLAANCAKLASVTLPSTATNMMKDCFANCLALEELEIPTNVNYMESGSVPATIKRLRVLNPNAPVLADGVFTANQSDVECYVALKSVNKFKAAAQWQYLNIIGDRSISTAGAELGCPTGLYFATSDGKLMYKDAEGNIIDTQFNAGAHAFTLSSYKNRIYVADAGVRFTYQDPNQPLGDGGLFYVNRTNDIFYRVTVLNNEGGAPSEDPFTMFIDSTENKIYISDRNVGIHEMDADAVGLYGTQPFLMQNQWLPYYNEYISWGSITGGFTRDTKGVFWMSKKFNGLGIIRFAKSDIYSDGNIAGKNYNYCKLFADDIIKTFYMDEKNGYLWMHVMKDHNGCVPGIYRIALSKIAEEDAANAGNKATGWTSALKIADCELIDDSPVLNDGNTDSGEITAIAQITGDGENIYWGYIPPADDSKAIPGSTPLDPSNPLHKPGIKTIKANFTGTPVVTYAVEGVEVYGITGATFVPEPEQPEVLPESLTLNETEVTLNANQTLQLIATILPENVDNPVVNWSSSDENIATVDDNGLVTVVAPEKVEAQSCIITAASDAKPELTATCKINIAQLIAPTSLTLNITETILEPGQQLQLVATVGPEEAYDKSVTWTSSDEDIATVDEDGLVTIVAAASVNPQSVVITATSVAVPTLTATCTINLTTLTAPTSVTLNVTEAELAKGEMLQLIATVLPEEAYDKTVTWISSDENVATVDENGLVTAVNAENAPAQQIRAGELPASAIITATSVAVPTLFANCVINIKSSPVGVNDIHAGKVVVGTKYYNIAGMESDKPFNGVNIVVVTTEDGSTQIYKVVK